MAAQRSQSIGAFGPVRFPIFAPSGREWELTTANEPLETPLLAQVHGFHAAARPPVLFLEAYRCAVAAGKLVMLLDIDDGRQRFIQGHSDAVTCLAYSREQACGASGQVRRVGAKCAEVILWCPTTQKVLATYVYHQADVEVVGFAQRGEALITISADRDHTMALWPAAREGFFQHRRRETVPLVVSSAYKSGDVYGMLPAPEKPGAPPQFVTFGAVHVKFWHTDRLSPALSGRRGAFGTEGAPRAVVTAAWVGSCRLVAGGSDGEVFFFEGTRAIRCVKPHPHSVALLLPLTDSLLVVSSRGLCSLIHAEAPKSTMDLASLPGAPDPRMQSLIVGGAAWQQKAVLLASKSHLMYLDLGAGGPPNAPQPLQSCRVLLAQPSSAITALCPHPTEPVVITGSLDGGVRSYRSNPRGVLMPDRSFRAPAGVTCMAISGGARGASAWLALGCSDGTLVVLSEESHHYVCHRCLSPTKSELTCAAFSTSDLLHGTPLWLAVGSADGTIHTLRFKEPVYRSSTHTGAETVEKVATLRGHSASVFQVSFADTLPCAFLLSVDVSGQALVFDVAMARRLPSMALVRDVPFSPWTSPIGWQVAGCWKPQRASETARLPPRYFCEVASRSMIAASDAGEPAVELYPFPCPTQPHFKPARLEGLVEPVTALQHCPYGNWLAASSDTLLFVWAWAPRAGGAGVGGVASGGDQLPLPSTPPRRAASGLPGQGRPMATYESPDGRKHAMPSEYASLLTPQRRTPSRSRLGPPFVEKAAVAADKVRFDLGVPDFGDAKKSGAPAFRPPSRASAEEAFDERGSDRSGNRYAEHGDNYSEQLSDRHSDDQRAAHNDGRGAEGRGERHESSCFAGNQYGADRYGDRCGNGYEEPCGDRFRDQYEDVDAYRRMGDGEPDDRVVPPLLTFGREAQDANGRGELQDAPHACNGSAPRRNLVSPQRPPYHQQRQQAEDQELDIDARVAQARPWSHDLDALAGEPPPEDWGKHLPPAEPQRGGGFQDAGPFHLARVGEGISETQRIREDTALRARSIHERHRHDAVGALLHGGGGPGNVPTHVVEAQEGACRECRVGKFICRLRDTGAEYEVEVLLQNGQIAKVTRNPSRRTITFEGLAQRQAQRGRPNGDGDEMRLSVRMPSGFDLSDVPSRLDRDFTRGWCAVAWPRRRPSMDDGADRLARTWGGRM